MLNKYNTKSNGGTFFKKHLFQCYICLRKRNRFVHFRSYLGFRFTILPILHGSDSFGRPVVASFQNSY